MKMKLPRTMKKNVAESDEEDDSLWEAADSEEVYDDFDHDDVAAA